VGIAPAPQQTAATAQRFGLRTVFGRPIIPGVRYVGSGDILTEKETASLKRFFDYLGLHLIPDLPEPQNGSQDRALCLANQFLDEPQKDQLLKQMPSYQNQRPWAGANENEFEVQRNKDTFRTQYFPQLLAQAPSLPLEFVYVSGVALRQYDMQKGGFPMIGAPNEKLNFPAVACLGYGLQGQLTHLPLDPVPPTFWSLDAQQAEQLIQRLPGDQNQQRVVYRAMVITLTAAPLAQAQGQYQKSAAPPLKVDIANIGLYEDKDLERPLHSFTIERDAPAVLLMGVPDSVRVPQPVVLDEETVALFLLKAKGDVIDRDAWETLARRALQTDQAYYQRTDARYLSGQPHAIVLAVKDPKFQPFFPKGFKLGHSPGLSDQQLAIFKAWILKRAAALPQQVKLFGSFTRQQTTNELKLVLGAESQRNGKSLKVLLQQQGYVPGQIVFPHGGPIYQLAQFDQRLFSGQGKTRIPVMVLANLVKSYQPKLTHEQIAKKAGANWRNLTAEVDLIIHRTEVVAVDAKNEGFVLFAEPLGLRLINPQDLALIYEQGYQVAALDPNQATLQPAVSGPTAQGPQIFTAEAADLLLAKHRPETLDQAAVERMMLARWRYETAHKGAGEPDWGRFFVEGKAKPDAQQRSQIAESFRDWTVKRAQVMPDLVTVVVSYARVDQFGQLVIGEDPGDSAQHLGRAIRSCRSNARSVSYEKPIEGKTYENACDFLEDAQKISAKELYIGNLAYLKREYTDQQMQQTLRKSGIKGAGPRMTCTAQDTYCQAMQKALREDLPTHRIDMNDVLVIDKQISLPADRPDLKQGNYQLEIDVKIVGARHVGKPPASPWLEAYKLYESFLLDADVDYRSGDNWVNRQEQKSISMNLLDGQVLEARLVDRNSGQLVAKLVLGALRGADTSLLQKEEPEQMAAPSGPSGPDVVGLQLGMSFAAADAVIREHMKVEQVFTADRAFQAEAAAGRLRPFTSGRLYMSEGGKEIIILYDEPPSAPEVVMGLVRQLNLPKGQVPANALFAKLRQKYGQEILSDQMGLSWGEEREAISTESSASGSAQQYPMLYCRAWTQPRGMGQIWRSESGQLAAIALATSGNYRNLQLPSLGVQGSMGHRQVQGCKPLVTAYFETRGSQEWDSLLIGLADLWTYRRHLDDSTRLLEEGAGSVGADDADVGIDLKL